MPPYKPIGERFWPKVTISDECWEWTASRDAGGYGTIGGERAGRILRTHRVAWELTNGPIPEGLCVLHRCDNRICVRPDHLFLGTKADNIHDMDAKGRRASGPQFGTQHAGAKLTEEDIPVIRAMRAQGISTRLIAARFGVSRWLIRRVVAGIVWKHAQPTETA